MFGPTAAGKTNLAIKTFDYLPVEIISVDSVMIYKKCNVGKAFICSANDECGTNTSKKIAYKQKTVRAESEFDENSGCYYLQPGILSKLVIFGDKLFANITTDSDKQEDTLVTLLGGEGEISVYRGSWRENY